LNVFERLDCVCLHTDNLEVSLSFLKSMSLVEAWRLDREDASGQWTIVGLDFPDRTSSQLVLSTHPDRRFIEIEIRVKNVREGYKHLTQLAGVRWIAEPFPMEVGHVAVMTSPDGNNFVLIGD